MSHRTHSHRKPSTRNGAHAEAESSVNHLLNSAGQMMEEGYDKASEVVHASFEHGRDMAAGVRDEAIEYVQASPMKSVLVAAGVGMMIGFVLGRKH